MLSALCAIQGLQLSLHLALKLNIGLFHVSQVPMFPFFPFSVGTFQSVIFRHLVLNSGDSSHACHKVCCNVILWMFQIKLVEATIGITTMLLAKLLGMFGGSIT